jgi:GDP-L-fucose synthase
MRPEFLMTGPLESTNEAYATAKIAGIKLCQAYRQQHDSDFITVIPANIFGPGDDFSPENSHVISGLMRRMHEARMAHTPHIELWGTGRAEREFIFVNDLADACVFLMQHYSDSTPINVGAPSQRFTIRNLAQLIKEITGYEGKLRFDSSKPDGMPRKLLDSSALEDMGWKPCTDFRKALSLTYEYFLESETIQPKWLES